MKVLYGGSETTFRLNLSGVVHFTLAPFAQPDQDCLAQNILLTLANSLALPANIQRKYNAPDITPHCIPVFGNREIAHNASIRSGAHPGEKITSSRSSFRA
jgi:hypothetical protein